LEHIRRSRGSILSLTDNNGASVFKATYDAWGRQTVSQNTIGFARGYTGHEHLPEFGLIDMNGRMYDPLLGRFLSPDPYVQMADYSQNFNRYSYCLNNPLIYTDPSGEFIFTLLATIIPGAQPLLPFAVAADISWMTDYGMQVAMNHMNGQSGSDAWFKNIDWFDVGLSAVIGGVTGGYSAEYKALKEGERLSKFGTWVYKNRKLITLGEMVATSAVDITGEGFQKVDMSDFSTRMAINLTTFGLTELASNGTKGLVKNPGSETAKSGTALARELGVAGEEAVGITGPKTSINVDGRTRIPDRLTGYTLEEVKNVKSLSFTRQLRDFQKYSQLRGLDFILYTRPNTILSSPLQQAIDNGLIIRKFIPGL